MARVSRARDQDTAGPPLRRVGMCEEREIGDRHAVKIHHRVAVLDLLILDVLQRRTSADIPQRWRRRVLLAQITGGINGSAQFVDGGVGAARPVSGQPPVLRQ